MSEENTQPHSAPQKLKNASRRQETGNPTGTEMFSTFSPVEDDFPDLDTMNVSSATELTGMMFRPPANAAELESYHDLYDMQYEAAIVSKDTKKHSKVK